MQNINHATRTKGITFLSPTENMCSSPVSSLSYTGTDDSSALLRHSGVWCPSAGICCDPTNPIKNQSLAGKYFFSEVSNYPVNNRGVLALEVPQKTKPPQEERELYWILLKQFSAISSHFPATTQAGRNKTGRVTRLASTYNVFLTLDGEFTTRTKTGLKVDLEDLF